MGLSMNYYGLAERRQQICFNLAQRPAPTNQPKKTSSIPSRREGKNGGRSPMLVVTCLPSTGRFKRDAAIWRIKKNIWSILKPATVK